MIRCLKRFGSYHLFSILVFCIIIVNASICYGQNNNQAPFEKVKWQHGPCIASLGNIASINLPQGYIFANAEDTKYLMELMQNPPSGLELGFVATKNSEWFAVFEFDETGYIKDDEKDSLDADAMLKAIQSSNEKSNEERTKRGWPTLTVLGWQQPPYYDQATHNLEWGIRGQSESSQVVNYSTRILGRKGVMRVTLVCDPNILNTSIPDYKMILANFGYTQGHRYEQFVQGDKVAEYGLSALVVGGAAAVAAKTGVFKWLWKVILAGVIGIGVFLKNIFSRKA